jgi:tetratricopeptide (TPR) repeat protein
LLERAGEVARMANRLDEAERLLRAAFTLCDEAGAAHDRARVAAELGLTLWRTGHIEQAIELMEGAFAVLGADEPDADVAMLAAQLGRLHFFSQDRERGLERVERALEIAERLDLPDVLASALNTKSLFLYGRRYESDALLRQALRIALDHDLVSEALRAYTNLLLLRDAFDRPEEVEPTLNEALDLARRRGDRYWEVRLAGSLTEEYRYLGRWEEARTLAESLPLAGATDAVLMSSGLGLARIAFESGDDARAKELLDLVGSDVDETDHQLRNVVLWRTALRYTLDGRLDEAARALCDTLPRAVDFSSQSTAETLHDLSSVVRALGATELAEEGLAALEDAPPGVRTRLVESQSHRLRAILAAIEGREDDTASAYGIALANARSVGYPFFLAPVLRDYGVWLVSCGRAEDAAPLLAEARELYTAMGASARIEELDAIGLPSEVAR